MNTKTKPNYTLRKVLFVTALLMFTAMRIGNRVMVRHVVPDIVAEIERWDDAPVTVHKSVSGERVFSETMTLNELDDFSNDFVEIDDVSDISFSFNEAGLQVNLEGTDVHGDAVTLSADITENDSSFEINVDATGR